MSRYDELLAKFPWWSALHHEGLLIAPQHLARHLPAEIATLAENDAIKLRSAVELMLDATGKRTKDALTHLLDIVLTRVCRLGGPGAGDWYKGNDVPDEYRHRLLSGERMAPRRLWKTLGSALPLFTVDPARCTRLRVGRGRRERARVLEWMRKADQPLALLTNGREWQLIHAGPDHRAFCEWNIDRWFVEGQAGAQVDALRILIGPDALRPTADGEPCPLLAAIEASRHGQAELSAELGERVRRAVETLIRASAPALNAIDGDDLSRDMPSDTTNGVDDSKNDSHAIAPVDRRAIYIAACRIVMCCVVVLFAEAREGLLPRSNRFYEGSYSLQGLRAQLDIAAGGRGGERLRNRHGAWPRLLALFRLLYTGSPHPELTIPAYGGDLFRPGNPESADPVDRALAAFEQPRNLPADSAVYRILELLTRSRVKVRQGTRNTWVEAPVDFSDLSSEYIGILYEGLLDFELRRVPDDEVIVFVSVGDRPALPFTRLDAMTSPALAELFGKLKKSGEKIGGDGPDEEEEAADEPESDEGDDADEASADGSDDDGADTEDEEEDDGEDGESDDEDDDDVHRNLSEQVQLWSVRAVQAAKLVRAPKDDTDPLVRARYDEKVRRMAKRLVDKKVLPGEWYLVRWGGTRKGSGTFYTRPQLAGPLTRRTLKPLLYEDDAPRPPKAILELKVCDPAMGSGSFLLAALRAVTDALFESLHHHERLAPRDDGTVIRLADGDDSQGPWEDIIPVPRDHEQFDDRLRARLKRHVVERCIYGVDLDPLAVELARLALWVETMDRSLPFSFIDHKLRAGNSLVGCWFDRFRHYPLMAWMREGGDKGHKGVHHVAEIEITRGKYRGKTKAVSDLWTRAIKERKSDIADEMAHRLRAIAVQPDLYLKEALDPGEIHETARARLDAMADMRLDEQDRKAKEWRELVEGDDFQAVKQAFDRWCALWFWPGDKLDLAPTPANWREPPAESEAIVAELAARHRFFHWELMFPDVFHEARAGFDAIVGNPPWDIQKPSSMEFFSNHDPLYRTYGKQQALRRQQALFEAVERIERDWLAYCAGFKALSNWVKYVAEPFGSPDADKSFSLTRKRSENALLHEAWAGQRADAYSYADPEHPYQHQGSADLNTYKMFTEVAYSLTGQGGRMGLLMPSGIYTDLGTLDLRRLLLDRCEWTDLLAFQNERFVFVGVDHRFKMAAIGATRGGATKVLRTRFRLGPANSPTIGEVEEELCSSDTSSSITRGGIRRFSPETSALLEAESAADYELLDKLYGSGSLLGGSGAGTWSIGYTREYDMTNDSRLFRRAGSGKSDAQRVDAFGNVLEGAWRPISDPTLGNFMVRTADGAYETDVRDVEHVLVPLYQGAMVHQYDVAASEYDSQSKTSWARSTWPHRRIKPKYFIAREHYLERDKVIRGAKIAFRDIARSTDTRTMIASLIPDAPCGNTLGVLSSQRSDAWTLVSALNSLAFDWSARLRMGGTHLNLYVISELPLPAVERLLAADQLADLIASLAMPHVRFAREWLGMKSRQRHGHSWRSAWAVSSSERARLSAIIEACTWCAYGLESEDARTMTTGCDHPIRALASSRFTHQLDPKGFWRVERDKEPELRHTVLAQVAFHDLQQKGLQAFLDQNDGEGWMLPETLRLADYGLGHDDRAKEHQPVAARLGPRFLPWQLEEDPAVSWDECARHAEILETLLPSPQSEPPKAPDTASTSKDLKQTGFGF